MSTLVKNKY